MIDLALLMYGIGVVFGLVAGFFTAKLWDWVF